MYFIATDAVPDAIPSMLIHNILISMTEIIFCSDAVANAVCANHEFANSVPNAANQLTNFFYRFDFMEFNLSLL